MKIDAAPSVRVPDARKYYDEHGRDDYYALGWNDCRAAMLAAGDRGK